MKNFYKLSIALLFSVQLNAQSAIDHSLIPKEFGIYDIGSPNKNWYNGYFSGKLYIGASVPDVGIVVYADAIINEIFIGRGRTYEPSNTIVGTGSLSVNVSGRNNTTLGYYSLYKNNVGYDNTAIGCEALYNNLNGTYNTALGSYALLTNDSGIVNTAIGSHALYYNKTGFYNSGIGNFSLFNNTKGSNNTVIGNYGMYYNVEGSNNTSTGFEALFFNKTGDYNTASGYFSMYSNDNGRDNTAAGLRSLFANVSGNGNTANGKFSMQSNVSGSWNTTLGYGSDVATENLENAMALGYKSKVNAKNKVQVGNTTIGVIGGQVGWSTFSDGRFKSNVQENVPGLLFIKKLRPVTYNVEVEKFEKYVGTNDSLEMTDATDYNNATKKIRTGFIAQEVEKTVNEIKYDFDGLNKPTNEKDNYSLVYADFVPSLVKSVQELSSKNDSLQQTMQSMQQQIDQLKSMLSAVTSKSGVIESLPSANASLEQNTPNPYKGNTFIQYTLPATYNTAFIRFTDNFGKEILSIPLSGFGKSQVNFNASKLASGAYHYALIVDGKIIAAKTMILVN